MVQTALFGQTIQDLIISAKLTKLKNKNIVVAIPENQIIIQTIDLPQKAESNILNVLEWQSKELLNFSTQDCYYDYKVISSNHEIVKVLIVAVSKKVVDSLISSISLSHFNIISIDTKSGSYSRLFATTPHKLIVMVEINKSDITVVIAKNFTARMSSTIRMIDNHSNLVAKIQETIQYYLSRKEPNKRVDEIILVGDVDENLADQIFETLKIKITLGANELRNKVSKTQDLSEYIVNLGLYHNLENSVNLLPPIMKSKIQKNTLLDTFIISTRNIMTSFFICILSISLLIVWLFITKNINSQKLKALKNKQNNQSSTVINDVNVLNSKLNDISKIINPNPKVANHLIAISNIANNYGQIKSINYDTTHNLLSISGNTADRIQLTKIVEQFKTEIYIDKVNIDTGSFEQPENIPYTLNLTIKNEK